MKLSNIVEAKTDTKHTVFIPIEVSNGNGNAEQKKMRVVYRPLTEEILSVRSLSEQLAAMIVEWSIEDEGIDESPTAEVLSKQPLSFLGHLSEAIASDYIPQKKS